MQVLFSYNVSYLKRSDEIELPSAIPRHDHKRLVILCSYITNKFCLIEKLNPATMFGDVHHHSNSILWRGYHSWRFCCWRDRGANIAVVALGFCFAKIYQFLIRRGPCSLDVAGHVLKCFNVCCDPPVYCLENFRYISGR